MLRIPGQGLLLLSALALQSQTPIIITGADMASRNDSVYFTNVSPSSIKDYLSTGEDYLWDFSMATETGQGMRNFESPSKTPYPFFFFGNNTFGELISATLGAGPVTITDYYNFYNKQSAPVNAFVAEGVGLTFSNIPLPAYYSNKDELYVFPLEYGDRDSTTFRFATITSSMLPLSFSKTGHRITEVDGWGTVITPSGSEKCIRIVTTQYALDSVKVSLLPFPLGYQNYVRSYQWLTLKGKTPFFEVSGTLLMGNFTPNSVTYRGSTKDPRTALAENQRGTVRFFPNPVLNNIMFKGIDPGSHYRVTSVSGAVLMAGTTGGQTIDVSSLAPGIYFLRINSGVEIFNHRFAHE